MDTQRQLRVIWNYRWWIVLLCILTGVATYLGTSKLPRTYQGTTLVQLVPGRQASGQYVSSDELLQDMNNYSDLGRTSDVANLARQQGHLSISTAELQKEVKLSPEADVSVLQFVASDRNPGLAATYANAYAHAFISYVEQRAQTTQQRQVSAMDQRVADVEHQLEALKSSTDPAAPALRSELQTLQTQEALMQSQVGDDAVLIESATVPSTPASPKPLEDAALALLGALVLGAGLAYLYDLRSDRYDSGEDASADLGLTLLGELPVKSANKKSERRATEAVRVLRTSVEFALAGIDHSAVVITSPEARSGKSFVTENLSRAFAANGRTVIAVDADLHRPTLHSRLHLEAEPGLGDILERRQPSLAGATAQSVPLSAGASRRGGRLLALTSGQPIHDPAETLSTPTMGATVASLRRENDLVIIDSPPLLACVDALAVARESQGVILVVDGAKGRRREARKAVQMLRAVDTRVLGFVFNRSDAGRASYYYGYAAEYASELELDHMELPQASGAYPIATNGHNDSRAASGRLPHGLSDVVVKAPSKR